MKIGILGSGLMGGNLGTLWAREGHDVTFSYARRQEKLTRLATEANTHSGTPEDAAREADVVLLAVHWSRIDDVLAQAGNLANRVLLNCSVPLDQWNRDLVVGTTTSGSEQLAARLPSTPIVGAFNTIPSESLPEVHRTRNEAPRPHLLYYGDDTAAKQVATQLIRDVGYDPLDAGPLRTARFVEPFAMVTAELAYAQPGGPELVYRFSRLDSG